ncbi:MULTISPECIES: hypothetical protein [unclassified Streptomyces]|uniref:hypothetical protein n=1 Tax=unclassified Streptomyces TaxID=2593676 RepID=UPI0036F5035F
MPRPRARRRAPFTAWPALFALVLSLLLPVLVTGPAAPARAADGVDLTDCVSTPVNDYGTAPTAVTPPGACRSFTAPTTGPYDVLGIAESDGTRTRLAVYDETGATVCEPSGDCRLTAGGTYRVASDRPTLVLDRSSARGCTAAAVPGTAAGSFDAPGETDCLSLSLPESAQLQYLTQLDAPPPYLPAEVVNRAGETVCPSAAMGDHSCELTGPAPYRVLLSAAAGAAPTGTYRLALYRTDVPEGCPVLPAGDFTADGPKGTVKGSAEVFSQCFSIPAGDHTTTESIQAEYADGTPAAAEYTVVDPTGAKVCGTRSAVCSLTPGTGYTVLVRAHLYAYLSLVRRDVTGTARGCVAQPATAAGGVSRGGPLGKPGTLVCHQVTTDDARDVLHVDLRDAKDEARAFVYDAEGRPASCPLLRHACALTGSTRYQAVFSTPYWSAPSYRIDALRIATAAGPAPECVRVPNLRNPYGPITGTLDEDHPAVCAVLPTMSADDLLVPVRDTAGGTSTTAKASLWDAGLVDRCRFERGSYRCALGDQPNVSKPSPSTLVLGLPDWASQTAYAADVTCNTAVRPLCGGEPVSATSVSPPSAPRGARVTLTVHGTSLSPKDPVVLTRNGTTLRATPVAVSPDARTLTVTVDLSTAAVGEWRAHVYALGADHVPGTVTVTPAVSGLGSYVPVTPTRLMDTRSGIGVAAGKVGPGGTVTLQVTGREGIPATGVSAVVLNVTATGPTASSFVSVHPNGTPRTSASNLNFTAGQTIPNLVVVPVVNGKVDFYNRYGTVDLVADVAGYYVTDGTGATYKPLTPTRLMDTRSGIGVRAGKVGAGQTVTLPVTGVSGIPATGVTAVVLNVTATGPTASSFVSVHPNGTPRTSASNLNFTAGRTIPNLVVVPVVNGKVDFYNRYGTVDLVADVAGYFTTDGTGSAYKPITPTRLMDTRSGIGVRQGKVGPDQTVTLGVPAEVTAVVLNVTATAPSASSFVSVHPNGTPRTSASNLNFTAGQTISNLVVVPVVNGKVDFYNRYGTVDLVADVAGYYYLS